ncbi:hypothetical protein PF003_g31337 [Phytophthora fragariae]|nr:hypothetical protein PF003_g31337 [Phytophthora fragariae]
MHKRKPRDLENSVSYVETATPNATEGEPRRSSKMSVDDAENEHKGGV